MACWEHPENRVLPLGFQLCMAITLPFAHQFTLILIWSPTLFKTKAFHSISSSSLSQVDYASVFTRKGYFLKFSLKWNLLVYTQSSPSLWSMLLLFSPLFFTHRVLCSFTSSGFFRKLLTFLIFSFPLSLGTIHFYTWPGCLQTFIFNKNPQEWTPSLCVQLLFCLGASPIALSSPPPPRRHLQPVTWIICRHRSFCCKGRLFFPLLTFHQYYVSMWPPPKISFLILCPNLAFWKTHLCLIFSFLHMFFFSKFSWIQLIFSVSTWMIIRQSSPICLHSVSRSRIWAQRVFLLKSKILDS